MATHLDSVKRYYEANTRKFLRHGQHGGARVMHQPLWAPGITDLTGAVHYVHRCILEVLEEKAIDRPTVVDLGCGIGSSMAYLGQIFPATYHGVTLSEVQAQLGGAQMKALGQEDRIQVYQGNYLDLPPEIPPFHLAYAIEAFVHGPDPGRFFQHTACRAAPGAHLVLCDDMLSDVPPPERRADEAHEKIASFKQGWRVASLLSLEQMTVLAAAHGWVLEKEMDFTPFLRLRRVRDQWIDVGLRLLGPVGKKHPYLMALRGGRAKQYCLHEGWIRYRFVVFRKKEKG